MQLRRQMHRNRQSPRNRTKSDNKKRQGESIPSIAKQNLETGPTQYTVIPGGTLYPPYSYFRYQIIEEPAPQGAENIIF